MLFSLLISCQKSGKISENLNKKPDKYPIDTGNVIVKYKNTLYTIPSPYQASSSIKSCDIGFKKDLLNPVENVSKYNSNFQKALNIGIYGTDLGYLNIYNQTPDLLPYFSAMKKLSEELGLTAAINDEIIAKVERNINNEDSLIHIISDTYRSIDRYLKENNRDEMGVLIVTGGWIESLYILSQNTLEANSRDVITRLGEQKYPLNNIIELLSPYYYQSIQYTKLIDDLVDLAYEFDGIIYNYVYEKPIIIQEEHTTIINSTSNVIVSEYHLRTIANKISSIRNSIIY